MRSYKSQAECERIRTEACRCAAAVMAGRPDEPISPNAWNLAVFFESYIAEGASKTLKDFGPKEPAVQAVLTLVKR